MSWLKYFFQSLIFISLNFIGGGPPLFRTTISAKLFFWLSDISIIFLPELIKVLTTRFLSSLSSIESKQIIAKLYIAVSEGKLTQEEADTKLEAILSGEYKKMKRMKFPKGNDI